ncbi:unnamed protein product [Musa banksii]
MLPLLGLKGAPFSTTPHSPSPCSNETGYPSVDLLCLMLLDLSWEKVWGR